jgi:hypothetical protein
MSVHKSIEPNEVESRRKEMGLRSDLDGLRFRMPGSDIVYLIDQGKKRGIPTAQVYETLFKNWDNIHKDIDIDAIDRGDDIDEAAFIFRFTNGPKVFLYEYGMMRHIVSPAVMERYQFRSPPYIIPPMQLKLGPEITQTGRPD